MRYKDIEKRRKAAREYYHKNIEKERIRGRKKHQDNKEEYNKKKEEYRKNNLILYSLKAKKYRDKYPNKIKAHRLAMKIPLKSNCEICGSKIKLERHHWNYKKPFLVNTLCQECHAIQHRRGC